MLYVMADMKCIAVVNASLSALCLEHKGGRSPMGPIECLCILDIMGTVYMCTQEVDTHNYRTTRKHDLFGVA